jgi:hypothetical protein
MIMKKITGPLLGVMALVVLVAIFALKTFLLNDSYSTTSGNVGFAAIVLGVAMIAGFSFFGSQGGGDADGVTRLTGPVVPLLYTMAAGVLFLLSPWLSGGWAKGLHIILLCAALFGIATWTLAAVMITTEDQAQKTAGTGRDGMIAALGGAERRISANAAPGATRAFDQLKDDINYADRSGSEATMGLEEQITTGLKALDMEADEAILVSAIEGVSSLVAERKALLLAGR